MSIRKMSTRRCPRSSVSSVMASAGLLAAMPALAQGAAPEGDSAAATTSGGLSEIVVTAQRQQETLQRTAAAVAVVNADDIVRSNLSSQTELGRLVPALSIQGSGGANTTLFVRGVGNFTVNGYSDPAVAFNYDGVYVGRPTSTSGYFFDLERIEVLKGPQGTLYGRNATGGAINVLPARPRLGELGGFAIGSIGNYVSPANFRVRGQLVDASGAGVVFVNGTQANLANSVNVTVVGTRVVNGALIADQVSFD